MPKKSKRSPMATYLGVAGACLVLVLLIWGGTTCNSTLGGNFGQFFNAADERGRGGEFDYVGNGSTMQYWPNKSKYVKTVPESQRIFFDSEWLKTTQGKSYTPGPR